MAKVYRTYTVYFMALAFTIYEALFAVHYAPLFIVHFIRFYIIIDGILTMRARFS